MDAPMVTTSAGSALAGKKGLIVGIANEHSIAWGCAKALRAQGAELAATWQDERARPFVQPLTEQLGVAITAGLDVEVPGEMELVFAEIERISASLMSWSSMFKTFIFSR